MRKVIIVFVLLFIIIPISGFCQARGFIFGLSAPIVSLKSENSSKFDNSMYGLGGKIGIENWIFELNATMYFLLYGNDIERTYDSITSNFNSERKLIYQGLVRFYPRKLLTPYCSFDWGITNSFGNEAKLFGKSFGFSLGLEKNYITDKYSVRLKSFSLHFELKYSFNYFTEFESDNNSFKIKSDIGDHMLMLMIEIRKFVDFGLFGN